MLAKKRHTGLTAVACNAAEAARTITLDVDDEMDRATSVGIGYSFTPGAAGVTVVTVVLYKSANGGTTWIRVPAWTYAGGGIYDGEDYSQRVTLAAAGTFWVDVNMSNANALKAVFSTDTADAADAMTATVMSDFNR